MARTDARRIAGRLPTTFVQTTARLAEQETRAAAASPQSAPAQTMRNRQHPCGIAGCGRQRWLTALSATRKRIPLTVPTPTPSIQPVGIKRNFERMVNAELLRKLACPA